VQFLDLLPEIFDGGRGSTRHVFCNGRSQWCLVGAMRRVQRKHRLHRFPAATP
jgi:hypothetical protein